MIARIAEILVKPNDEVFAGEVLIRLEDDEVRTRWAKADLQVALRKRARPAPQAKDAARRKFEDAVGRCGDGRGCGRAQRSIVPPSRDGAAMAQRMHSPPPARRLRAHRKSASSGRPSLPSSKRKRRTTATELEGQFAMARVELRGAEARSTI